METFFADGDADRLKRLDDFNMQTALESFQLPDIGDSESTQGDALKTVRLGKRKSSRFQKKQEVKHFDEIKVPTLKAFEGAFELPTLSAEQILGEFEEAAVEVNRMHLHDLSMAAREKQKPAPEKQKPAPKKQKPTPEKQMTAAEQTQCYLLLKEAAGKDPNASIATRKPTRACANNDGTKFNFRPMVGRDGPLS